MNHIEGPQRPATFEGLAAPEGTLVRTGRIRSTTKHKPQPAYDAVPDYIQRSYQKEVVLP